MLTQRVGHRGTRFTVRATRQSRPKLQNLTDELARPRNPGPIERGFAHIFHVRVAEACDNPHPVRGMLRTTFPILLGTPSTQRSRVTRYGLDRRVVKPLELER